MLAPKYSAELLAALERRGVKVGQFGRDIVRDLAELLEVLDDELQDQGNKAPASRTLLGEAIAEVLKQNAAAGVLPGSLCGPRCWGCSHRIGGIHLAPVEAAGGGQ